MYTNLISAKVLINQMHVGMASVLGKVISLELVVSKMAAGFTEVVNVTEDALDRMSGNSTQIYKTRDGKYNARSLDELLEKIREAGAESEYFSDSDIDKLRDMFEEEEDEDEDEDDTLKYGT
jgi:hypothetical protein